MESHVGDAVMDGAILPALRWLGRRFDDFRSRGGSLVQHYLLYGVLTLVLLLLWIGPWEDLLRRLFAR